MGAFRKILLLLPLLLIVSAGAALGQTGYIGVYADPAGTECMLSDRGGREVNVYVVHQATSGAAASQWRIVSGGGFDMTYLGETWSTTALGDARSGVSTSYGACLASPILLCTVTYLAHGTSSPCSYLEVVADPASVGGEIEVVDCNSNFLSGSGGRLYVNPDGTCQCGQADNVRDTDWGRIKAMFTD
ncbi:MAG: hypothetical protein PVF33_09540 [Candidatus Latescibacterota bacterium]|jgi:hypothetical protein